MEVDPGVGVDSGVGVGIGVDSGVGVGAGVGVAIGMGLSCTAATAPLFSPPHPAVEILIIITIAANTFFFTIISSLI